MDSTVIVQVLGNSDIQVDGKPGEKQLEACRSFDDLQEMTRDNERDLLGALERVDFPLIRKMRKSLDDNEATFCFLLTDQSDWVRHHGNNGDGWNKVATSDGWWWEKILQGWCASQHIPCRSIRFPISHECRNGVADWEAMAQAVPKLLSDLLSVDNKKMEYISEEGSRQPVSELVVQHSSGTPALSSALYLWGIERKLEGVKVEFAPHQVIKPIRP